MLRRGVWVSIALFNGACNITLTHSTKNGTTTEPEAATDSNVPAAGGSAGAGGGAAAPITSAGAGSPADAPTSGMATGTGTPTGTGGMGMGTGMAGAGAVVPMQSAAGSASEVAGMGGMSAPGAAGVGGSTGALDPGALQCPNEVCAPLPKPTPEQEAMAAAFGVMFTIENCCATGGDCGTSLNKGECTRTPDSDPQCPAGDAMGFPLVSCCTAAGQCGIDASAVMMGCIDLATVSSMAMGFITVPAPQSCTPMAGAGM